MTAEYYDRNTPRFLRYGGGKRTAAIHRQIWAPGVADSEQAFLYLNQRVAQAIQPCLMPAVRARLLDLGCGVGGTATWMAEYSGAEVTAVTNSSVQARLAAKRAAHLGLSDKCRFLQADFLQLPDIGHFEAAWAIESFVHARDPQRFFDQAAGRLAACGRLVICDDFLTDPAMVVDAPEALRWIDRLRKGWHLESLLSPGRVNGLAEAAGLRLVDMQNLTPYLRLFSPRKIKAMRLLTRLPFRSAYWDNLYGGTALQVCQERGWVQYGFHVWEKPAS